MKRIVFLLLINSFLDGSHKISEKDVMYSGFHAQGAITNTTDTAIFITFWQKTHIQHNRIYPDIHEYLISGHAAVQPNRTIEIDKDATSVRIAELQSNYASWCSINPSHSYSIQKSEVLMLVNEATGEIIPDRRDNKPYK